MPISTDQTTVEGGSPRIKKVPFHFPNLGSEKASRSPKLNPLDDFIGMTELRVIVRPAKEDVFNAPAFHLKHFGHTWYSDVLTIYTNALRYETKILFFILYCLHERVSVLEIGDIESFYSWYEDYATFFETIIDVLQEVYLPWVECLEDLPSSKPWAHFNEVAVALKRTVRKTRTHSSNILALEPSKAAARLRSIFTKFAPRFLEFLSALEDSTINIVEHRHTQEDCDTVSKQMAAVIAQRANYRRNFVILLRWLEVHKRYETAASWRRKYMDTASLVSFGIWKRAGAQEDCLAYFKNKCRSVTDEALTSKVIAIHHRTSELV